MNSFQSRDIFTLSEVNLGRQRIFKFLNVLIFNQLFTN